jgi:hypothetical protein
MISVALVLLFLPAAHAVELWVGARDLGPASNVRRWLLDAANDTSSWADGLSVGFPPIFAPADLTTLSSAGVRLVPCIHSSLDTMQRQLLQDGAVNASAFTGAYTDVLPAFRAGTAAGPGPFMWWALTEDDSSGVGFPFEQLAVPPSSHADAWAQFDNYLARAQVLSSTLMPGTPLVAQVGFAEQAHAHFARGAALAVVERANDDIGDLSTALAFARGGARQFNATFGVDLSWWWGVLYSGVNALPGAYHRRHAFLSLYAGASVVNVEGGDGLCDGAGAPLPLGAEVQAFGEFVRRHGLPRGLAPASEPVVPVLIVLPKDHGYATRPYWLTRNEAYGYARLPPRVGDRAIGGFFFIRLSRRRLFAGPVAARRLCEQRPAREHVGAERADGAVRAAAQRRRPGRAVYSLWRLSESDGRRRRLCRGGRGPVAVAAHGRRALWRHL